jgi:hypothetical protein
MPKSMVKIAQRQAPLLRQRNAIPKIVEIERHGISTGRISKCFQRSKIQDRIFIGINKCHNCRRHWNIAALGAQLTSIENALKEIRNELADLQEKNPERVRLP